MPHEPSTHGACSQYYFVSPVSFYFLLSKDEFDKWHVTWMKLCKSCIFSHVNVQIQVLFNRKSKKSSKWLTNANLLSMIQKSKMCHKYPAVFMQMH